MEAPLRSTIPLQKRKILKKTFNSVLKVLIFCGIISLFFWHWIQGSFGDVPESVANSKTYYLVLWFLALAMLVFSRMVYQILYFITYHYDVDGENFVIRKGVFTKREITLPFSKITDVYVDQDISDVMLGLYDVHISTPTVESGRFAHVDGLNRAGSTKLRKLILDSLNRSNPKA